MPGHSTAWCHRDSLSSSAVALERAAHCPSPRSCTRSGYKNYDLESPTVLASAASCTPCRQGSETPCCVAGYLSLKDKQDGLQNAGVNFWNEVGSTGFVETRTEIACSTIALHETDRPSLRTVLSCQVTALPGVAETPKLSRSSGSAAPCLSTRPCPGS